MVQWARTVLPPTPTAPIRGAAKGGEVVGARCDAYRGRPGRRIRPGILGGEMPGERLAESRRIRPGKTTPTSKTILTTSAKHPRWRSFALFSGAETGRYGRAWSTAIWPSSSRSTGGDEWWTLKKIGDGGEPGDWLAFENCSFGGLSRDRHGFNDLIVGMSAASASECERLEYRLPMLDEPWSLMTACSENRAGDQVECKILESRCGDYAVKAYERPSFDGAMLEISDRASRALVFHDGACDSIVSASGRARDALSSLIEGSRESDGRSRSEAARSRLRSLRDASSEARESSSAINPPSNATGRNGKARS